VEGDFRTPLLCDTDKEVASHPEFISHGDAFAWADLELPLRRHDFCVDTADPESGIEACTIVRLDQVTGYYLAST
jgi:hypothetical protein